MKHIIYNIILFTLIGLMLGVMIKFVNAEEIKDLTLNFTVQEIVETICTKMPFTNDKKCIKEKLECIYIDYNSGCELKEAIRDCF